MCPCACVHCRCVGIIGVLGRSEKDMKYLVPSLEARSSADLELAGSAAAVTAGSALQTVLRLQTCTHHICLLI